MIASQIICLIVLVLLGVYIFKKYPLKIQTKPMILVSLLLVVALVLSYFSMMLGLFGFPSLKIGFSQLPLMLLGVLFGPGYAYIAGLLFDLLGLMVTPTDLPFLGFTLGNVLVCVLPALWSKMNKQYSTKQVECAVGGVLGALGAITIYYVWTFTYSTSFVEKYMSLANSTRVIISVVTVAIVALIVAIVHFVPKRFESNEQIQVSNWMIAVILVELVVNLGLTPLWLQIMYGIPYVLNFFVRVLKVVVMIPLNTIIGYAVYRAVMRVYKA